MDTTYTITTGLQSLNKQMGDLADKGYQHKFRREADGLYCFEIEVWVSPDQFSVDAAYYFGNISNPDADRMLYAITTRSGIKGTLVDQYGVYTDKMSLELYWKLTGTAKQIRTPENYPAYDFLSEKTTDKSSWENNTGPGSNTGWRPVIQLNNQTRTT